MNGYRAVIFDLDGTLLDTLRDIALAANRVLEELGLPPHSEQEYRRFVGGGVAMLFRRAIEPPRRDDSRLIDDCVARFRRVYQRQWNQHTRPYEGITELVETLRQRKIPAAVLSNKPHEFTEQCVEAYFSPGSFRLTLGQRPGTPVKPDPAAAWEIARRLEVAPEHTVFVGDSDVDIQTALAAGMGAVGVCWGFRTAEELAAAGAEKLLEDPRELLPLFSGQ